MEEKIEKLKKKKKNLKTKNLIYCKKIFLLSLELDRINY